MAPQLSLCLFEFVFPYISLFEQTLSRNVTGQTKNTPNVASQKQSSTWDPVGYAGVGMGENTDDANQKLEDGAAHP